MNITKREIETKNITRNHINPKKLEKPRHENIKRSLNLLKTGSKEAYKKRQKEKEE